MLGLAAVSIPIWSRRGAARLNWGWQRLCGTRVGDGEGLDHDHLDQRGVAGLCRTGPGIAGMGKEGRKLPAQTRGNESEDAGAGVGLAQECPVLSGGARDQPAMLGPCRTGPGA